MPRIRRALTVATLAVAAAVGGAAPVAAVPVPGPPPYAYEESCVVRFTSVGEDPERPGNVLVVGEAPPCPAADAEDGFVIAHFQWVGPVKVHARFRYAETARFGISLDLAPNRSDDYVVCAATGPTLRSDCVAVAVRGNHQRPLVRVVGPVPTDDDRVTDEIPRRRPPTQPEEPGCATCWNERPA